MNIFSRFNVLSDKQHGFQSGKYCVDAIGQLLDFVCSAINDKKKHIFPIFLDLRKTYDTVNHKILHDKLEAYGIRSCALILFETYLNCRIQSVRTGDTISEPNEMTLGMPQGSVLKGLLFLVFINALPSVSKILFSL